MKSERRRARRAGRRALGKMIGKPKVDQLKSLISATKKAHNLCCCGGGDDERRYSSEAELQADDSPAEFCADCGKQRLRIVFVDDKPQSESDRITLWKGGNQIDG